MKILARWTACLAAALLSMLPARAAPPPVEAFFGDAALVGAVLSPSGRMLAVRSNFGGDRVGLGVYDLATGKSSRTAQFVDGDVHEVHWVNDDRLLFSVVDFSEGSGRGRGAPGLFSVHPDGSKRLQLVRRMGQPFITDGSLRKDRLLDWNHRLLTVPRPEPGRVNEEVLVVEFTPDERGLETPLWLNTRTGRTRPVEVSMPPDAVDWITDSRGELRVALTRNKGRQGALWRGPGQQDWQPLFESGPLNAPFGINAVDDAGTLYVTTSRGAAGESVLSRYDFERRAPAKQALVMAPGFDFNGRVLNDAGGNALGVRGVTDGEITVWQNAAMQALQKEADERMPGRINSISCRRCAQPDMVALVRSYSDRDPGSYWVYRAQPPEGEASWLPVGRLRPAINPAEMAPLDLKRIKARDGRDLPVWITRPAEARGPLPAVVLVHGGPWVRGKTWHWEAQAQFLASRGYVVIEPEFRGSAGFGHAHFKASFKQWGQAMQDDVADALRWAQKEGIASDKACIAGASYGGYSTLMGLIKDPELYRCGVAWIAVADLELLVKGSWWVDDDSGLARRYTIPEMIGDPEKDAAMLAAHSPVKQAARLKAPLLLAYGEEDRRVPLAHGKRMRDALREAGNEPEWVTYPGEGHGFAVQKNRIDFARRMEAFLARHLKPGP